MKIDSGLHTFNHLPLLPGKGFLFQGISDQPLFIFPCFFCVFFFLSFFSYWKWLWRGYLKRFSYQKSASSKEITLTVLIILLTASLSYLQHFF